MLESADLAARLSKEDYRAAMGRVDARLGALQRALREAGAPVIVLLDGWDAAGKGEVLGRLLQALDPRGFKVYHAARESEREGMFPAMRRFWLHEPAQGQILFMDHSWYRATFDDRLDGDLSKKALRQMFERIRTHERQWIDGGGTIVKFFMHISREEQARRFAKLLKAPAFAWRVGKSERRRHKQYDVLLNAAEEMLRETSPPWAPWTIVPAQDERFATAAVGETLLATFEKALAPKEKTAAAKIYLPKKRKSDPLAEADLSHRLSRKKYEAVLPEYQEELRRLQHECYRRRHAALIVYEGWDAAGKGGNIRRLVRKLDPRGYEVAPFSAPTEAEKAQHYLRRFWKALPKAGHWTIFDRSHYGRVLVERVEGFATPGEWGRAYREINEFEAQLVEHGTTILKFWIHISKEEQLRRFKARQEEKVWKITDDDWRNRKKWGAYYEAVSDMIRETSTRGAPWTVIEGDDKLHARVQAMRTVIARLRRALGEK